MKPSDDIYDIVIVGGGFSGLCVCYHLFRNFSPAKINSNGLKILLLEPKEQLGAGIAYQTNSPHHLLNVRARAMSISEAEPNSFVEWLGEQGLKYSPNDFAPRYRYRQYLQQIFSCEAERAKEKKISLSRKIQHLNTLKWGDDLFHLSLNSGEKCQARSVVLAVGNLSYDSPFHDCLSSPWDTNNFSSIEKFCSVAVVGAGLTAIDIVLEAESRGFKGKYYLVSTKGILPQMQRMEPPVVTEEVKDWAKTLAAKRHRLSHLLREIRTKADLAEDWQSIIESLRPHTQEMWRNFSPAQKFRFTRHLLSYWNVHRHRAPQSTLSRILELKSLGRLEQIKGKVYSYATSTKGVELKIASNPKASTTKSLFADIAFDGIGVFSNIWDVRSDLIRQLIADGFAIPDELNRGLLTNDTGLVENRLEIPIGPIYTMGTLRRGQLWESVAVPELRLQGRLIAEELLAKLSK